jgi:hypothetical protein
MVTRVGSWWTKSKSDPRWDMDGRGMINAFTGCPEMDKAIKEKEKELGEKPPKDLSVGGMKD